MKKLMIDFIFSLYKSSSFMLGMGQCKHYPTCSQYSKEAYLKYNFTKATALTLKRLLKCHPLSKGGYDPLP